MSTVPPDDKRPLDSTNDEPVSTDSDVAATSDAAVENTENENTENTEAGSSDSERFVVSSQGEATDADAVAAEAENAPAADDTATLSHADQTDAPAAAPVEPVFVEPATTSAASETVAEQTATASAASEPAASVDGSVAAERAPIEPEPLIEPEPYVPTPPPAVIIPPAVILPDAATPAASSTAPAAAGVEDSVVAAQAESAAEQRERSNAETAILSPEVLVTPVAVASAVAQPGATSAHATQPETVEPAATAAPSDIDAVPPRRKGNRGFGILLALAGSVVFAGVHAGITALVYLVAGRSFDIESFVTSSAFIVPTATFLVVFVLAALIINRAGWWAWALGSLVVAVVTYFASSGVILLLADIMTLTPSQAEEIWMSLLFSAPLIIALVVAREVSLWFGALISVRGRKVKARNAEARAAYDRDREQLATNSAI